MIGLLFLFIAIACILAEWTKRVVYKPGSKNKAIKNGNNTYFDYEGNEYDLQSGHPVKRGGGVTVDLKTGQIIKAEGAKTLEDIKNKEFEEYGFKGRVKYNLILNETLTLRYQDEIWIEKDTGKAYLLYVNHCLPKNERYQKYNFKEFPKTHINRNIERSFYPSIIRLLDMESRQFLTEEEYELWDLSVENVSRIIFRSGRERNYHD